MNVVAPAAIETAMPAPATFDFDALPGNCPAHLGQGGLR